jgi:serine protease AprX
MHSHRGFTWGPVCRSLGIVTAVVVLLAASVGGTLATTGSPYVVGSDAYSMANVTTLLGAQSWWDAGYAGAGVDVALIDSGVAPVQGLASSGKLIYGPDLSFESQSATLRNLDTYGHGTFMAGIIAGRDDSAVSPYSSNPASTYRGMAPDARIVSLKVATADGGTDVSQVIAAIDWVVQHKNDTGLNIRVINLSYGTNSTQAYTVDPLAFAVEQAWKAGIVVVAAAGNSQWQRGNNAAGLASPAYDPFIIGVGASDTNGTATCSDDRVAAFSASASTGKVKTPDFLAPGAHLQGLRVQNSYIDQTHPEGQLDARYARGSGTSEATAITSGAIALILQKYPNLTPDQVKKLITDNALKLKGSSNEVQGAGELSLGPLLMATASSSTQKFTPSTGTGSLELARGEDHISRDGVILQGEQDIFGAHFDSAAMALAEAAGNTWTGGTWNGNTWTGNTWTGNTWTGNTWTGNTWTGNTWTGNTWSGNTWAGNTWTGNTWTGSSFSGNTWTGNTWATDSWS